MDEYVWERSFKELEAYKLKYGHVDIKRVRGKHEKNPEYLKYKELADWITNEQKQIKVFMGLKKPNIDRMTGKPKLSNMKKKKKNRLLEIGIIFDKNDLAWNRNFEALKEFKKKHKHCKVQISYQLGDIKLGQWFHDQRKFSKPRKYKNYTRNELAPDRRKKLDALCPDWHIIRKKNG